MTFHGTPVSFQLHCCLQCTVEVNRIRASTDWKNALAQPLRAALAVAMSSGLPYNPSALGRERRFLLEKGFDQTYQTRVIYAYGTSAAHTPEIICSQEVGLTSLSPYSCPQAKSLSFGDAKKRDPSLLERSGPESLLRLCLSFRLTVLF